MSRVSIHYDDDTKTDFNNLGDALFHATQQGTAGIVNVRDPDRQVTWTRKQLDARVGSVQDESAVDASPENRAKVARRLAKD
jgi:hypothetical protein